MFFHVEFLGHLILHLFIKKSREPYLIIGYVSLKLVVLIKQLGQHSHGLVAKGCLLLVYPCQQRIYDRLLKGKVLEEELLLAGCYFNRLCYHGFIGLLT